MAPFHMTIDALLHVVQHLSSYIGNYNSSSTSTSTAGKRLKFRQFTKKKMENTLVLDCNHPSSQQITHHLKHRCVRVDGLMDLSLRGDSSTDAVFNAIRTSHATLFGGENEYCTSNHFDVDSMISVWCAMNPRLALLNEKLLREVAYVGDFRELRLVPGEEFQYQDKALKICCWLNSEERRLFYKPFEGLIHSEFGEDDSKFQYFLPIFHQVIENIDKDESLKSQWKEEYDRCVKEYRDIHDNNRFKVYKEIDLVLVTPAEPVHYYPLFSVSSGYDIVVAMYSGNRYEVELKYTAYIDLTSRPTFPRCEMVALCEYLNKIEGFESSSSSLSNGGAFKWVANRITDTGPLLRIESTFRNLSKSERYGHPYEREIYRSSIEPEDFEAIVVSYFKFGLSEGERKFDWSWNDLHDFNSSIEWSQWVPPPPTTTPLASL